MFVSATSRTNIFGNMARAAWLDSDKSYLNFALDAFGTDRSMTGSDWPVCTVCGDYQSVMNVVIDDEKIIPQDQANILGDNYARFYHIERAIHRVD